MPWTQVRWTALSAFPLVFCLAAVSPTLADDPPLEICLALRGAVFLTDTPVEDGPTLVVELVREGGHWHRAWGFAGDFTLSHHPGRVVTAEVTDESIDLTFSMLMLDDSWTKGVGGRGVYHASLKRTTTATFEGTYEGTFRGVRVMGRAAGTKHPSRPIRVPGYVPVEPGEHPRILFRKSDLPRLHEKAQTIFGQAALAKMDDAMGLGVKYQLTGDRRFAQQSAKLVEILMADRSDGSKVERSRPWGHRLEQVALAYDLCYDVWPEDFRHGVEEHMAWAANEMFYSRRRFDVHIQWHLASSYPGAILYGGALAGLALWGEDGAAPTKPDPPSVRTEPVPPDASPPGKGVPVSRFSDGEMPPEWIFAGGFQPRGDDDPLAGLGGVARARPAVGTQVSYGGRAESFRPIPEEKDQGYLVDERYTSGRRMIDVTNAIGRVYHSTSYFYTVIENDRPRWVRLATDYAPATAYLAGRRMQPGDFAMIEKGRYPFLIKAPLGETKPWGRHLMRPHLTEVPSNEAVAGIAAINAEYDERLADWQFDHDEWERSGHVDVRFQKVYEVGRQLMYLYYREGVGTGGFQQGSFSPMPMEGPNKYATAHRTMFGRDVSPYADVTHFVPFRIFNQVYPVTGKPFGQDINGVPGFRIDEYAEGRDVSGGFLAALFPIVPDDWQPAALWAWHCYLGISDETYKTAALSRGNPVYAFLHYPLDMKPQPPSGSMPLSWEAPDAGYYGLRNGFSGQDDFLAQVFVKAKPTGGVWQRDNAGTFRLMGLGHLWAHGPTFRLNTFRWMENVVLLPDDDTNPGACGKVRYAKLEKDGSGVVSFDLGDVYASTKTQETTRNGKLVRLGEPLYERYGSFRRDSAFQDSGITGLRSIAVDYSGLSGAPCLMVVVDRIRGGGRKVWTWQLGGIQMYGGERANLNPREIDRGDLDRTRVDGNSFIIDKGDANLRGTFMEPTRVKLAAETRLLRGDVWFKRDKQAGQDIRMHCNGLFAEGGDDYFVVITVQRGEPPEVKIQGRGLSASATVGRRKISFDGEKLVLGK